MLSWSFVVLCLLSGSGALAKESPEARTQQLIDALQKRHAHPAAQAAAGPEAADPQLDALFDFERLGTDPIAPHQKSFKPAQLQTFKEVFGALIRSKALHSGAALCEGTLSIATPVLSGKKARVEVHVVQPEKDVDLRITFVWEDEGSAWRVVDVELDGSSVVKDYQNQFGRILKKDGPEVLIKKIRARLDEARKAT
jgi:phospholipid transport system substrate-binding protein